MSDNYNNIDDFFRNKLNASDGGKSWDKPNGQVWENAQANFSRPTWRLPFAPLSVATAFLSIGLLAALGYIFNTNNQLKDVNKKLAITQELLNQKENILQSAQKSCLINEEKYQILLQNANDEIVSLNRQVADYKKSNQNQLRKINVLTTEKIALEQQLQTSNNPLVEQQEVINPTEKTQKTRIITKEDILKARNTAIEKAMSAEPAFQFLAQKDLSSLENTVSTLPNISHLVLPTPAKPFQRFEIGLGYSALNIQIPSNHNFENTNAFQIKRTITNQVNHGIGAHIGFAPVKNFFLRAGIRQTQFSSQKETEIGFIYNQSTEYVNANGDLSNDFYLKNTTTFSETEQKISAAIPYGQSTGDVVFANVKTLQDFELTQFPIGFAWYRGLGRWQWEFQAGMTWNNVALRNSSVDVELASNNQNIAIQSIANTSNQLLNNRYWGSYLGYGASYKWNKHLQLRAGFTLEDNLPNFNFSYWSNLNLSNIGWNLSANYRF